MNRREYVKSVGAVLCGGFIPSRGDDNLEMPPCPTLEYLQSQNKNIRSIGVTYWNDWSAIVTYGEKRPPHPFYVNYQTVLLVYSGSWIAVEEFRLKPPYYNKQIPWPDWLPHF